MVVVLKANATGGGGGGSGSSVPEVIPIQGVVTSVPTNAWATVVSLIVTPGFNFKFTGVIATGSSDGEWAVYDDTVELYRSRTSSGDRGFEFTHNPISISAGSTLALKVVHQEVTSQNFEGTLMGYYA